MVLNTTLGNLASSTQSDIESWQPKAMPKAAKTGELWERFLVCLGDLSHVKATDQATIGRVVGVGQTMVSQYKTGDKNPSLDVARRMASYAEMCVEYLLTGNGPRRPWSQVDSEFKKLVQFWELLDDHHRRDLLSVAEGLHAKQGRPRKAGGGTMAGVDDTAIRLRKKSPH